MMMHQSYGVKPAFVPRLFRRLCNGTNARSLPGRHRHVPRRHVPGVASDLLGAGPVLAGADRHRTPLVDYLERTEQTELHRATVASGGRRYATSLARTAAPTR